MSTRRAMGILGAAWGAAGVFALLCFAIWRLAPKALAAFHIGLTAGQWGLALAVCAFMAYAEGYRGFQKRFSPRTAARVRHLRDHPNGLRSLLAPLFVMGFFHSTRRTKVVALAMTFGILVLVLLVDRLDQPWRGIVDAGVVVGLSWGVVSLAIAVNAALTGTTFTASAEVPLPRLGVKRDPKPSNRARRAGVAAEAGPSASTFRPPSGATSRRTAPGRRSRGWRKGSSRP